MRAMRAIISAAILAAGVSCAAIVGIPEREGSYCARGREHDLCDDFDNDKGFAWSMPDGAPELGMTTTRVAGGVSPPNALRIDIPPLPVVDRAGATIFGHRFSRGVDGIRVSAKIKIDKNGLPFRDASIVGDAGPDGATILLFLIQWDAGLVALAMRNEGLYLLDAITSTVDSGILAGNGRQLATVSEIAGRWLPVAFEVHLTGQEHPYVSIFVDADFGRPPAGTFEIDEGVRRLSTYTHVLYGAIVIPPNAETSILFDDLTADYPRGGG
jgi:hypothetical protein